MFIVLGTGVVAVAAIPVVLYLLGFSAAGVMAGTIAANVQVKRSGPRIMKQFYTKVKLLQCLIVLLLKTSEKGIAFEMCPHKLNVQFYDIS